MKRGFTLVEVIIVITVITILTTISVLAFDQTQNQTQDASVSALASLVKSGAENHYSDQNEYPVAKDLLGAASEQNAPPASYSTAASRLGLSLSTLTDGKAKLIPCYSACTQANFNKIYVYYLTKFTSTETTAYAFSFTKTGGGSCTYTLPSPEYGSSAYIIAIWSEQDSRWDIVRSDKGVVNTSDATACPFKRL